MHIQNYFLNFDLGPGKRISLSQPIESLANVDNYVSTYDAYFAYEQDLTNLVNTGRQWMGESFAFNPYQVFNHTSQHIDLTEPVTLFINVALLKAFASLILVSELPPPVLITKDILLEFSTSTI